METIQIQDWVIRFREPKGEGPHPVIWLFHGWQGDEYSMEVFTSKLPERFLLLAPRGPYKSKRGGNSWYHDDHKGWPKVEAFSQAVEGLIGLMANWPLTAPWGDFDRFHLAGFSQGAALAYAFTFLHPNRVNAVAGLAGFVPEASGKYLKNPALKRVMVYISHGSRDQIVPISKARQAAHMFESIDAQVVFCESDVGHKLDATCFKGLEKFFEL
jgi:phospholipase/carboxylesterase